jgi:hypothetical protein
VSRSTWTHTRLVSLPTSLITFNTCLCGNAQPAPCSPPPPSLPNRNFRTGRNGDNAPSPNPAWEPRNVTWTHYYGKEDTYSRIDFLLISPGLAREWLANETYVLTLPNWGVGSDHRPIMATFEAADK